MAKPTGRHSIKGYAGSGMTIVLTHTAILLQRKNRIAKVCSLTFTHASKDLTAMGLAEAGAKSAEVRMVNEFLDSPQKYSHILIHEVQDIATPKLKVVDLRRFSSKSVLHCGIADANLSLITSIPT